jgi:Tfp pilus assembly protein PilN
MLKVPLDTSQIYKGRLYNLSFIFSLTQKFIKQHLLKKPLTVICMPPTVFKEQSTNSASILQACLCFCKTGVKIYKIINHSLLTKEGSMKFSRYFSYRDLEGQLDFFKLLAPRVTASLIPWIRSSILLWGILLAIIGFIHVKTFSQFIYLQKEEKKLIKQNDDLKDKLHTFHCLQKTNKEMQEYLNQIKKLKQSSFTAIPHILKTISLSVQKHTWLSQIKVSQINKKSGVQRIIHKQQSFYYNQLQITANTFNDQEITPFIKQLSCSPFLHNIKLESIQREKQSPYNKINQTHPSFFRFTLSGNIPKQTLKITRNNIETKKALKL